VIDVAEVEDALRVWVVATAGHVRHENTAYATEDGGTDVPLRWFDLARQLETGQRKCEGTHSLHFEAKSEVVAPRAAGVNIDVALTALECCAFAQTTDTAWCCPPVQRDLHNATFIS